MIRAFSRAFAQLSDPRLRRYIWLCLGATLAVVAILWGAVIAVLAVTQVPSFTLFGTEIALDLFADVAGAILFLVVLGLMFPSVLLLLVGFFLEDIAQVVEDRHYPDLPAARGQSITEIMAVTLKFAALSIVLNLLALPVFLLLLFIPPFNFFVFYAVNGYLLGREYFELVAHRRLSPEGAMRLRRAFGGHMFVAGIAIAALMSVPVLNLFVPVVATAAMVHLIHGWRERYHVGE